MEDVSEVEPDQVGGVCVFLFLGSFCFDFYLVLVIGLNQRFKPFKIHHPVLLSAGVGHLGRCPTPSTGVQGPT